ncbi:MAG: hypothetical protein ACPHM5_07940, partial [Candidatus Micropelagos thuwalensis]
MAAKLQTSKTDNRKFLTGHLPLLALLACDVLIQPSIWAHDRDFIQNHCYFVRLADTLCDLAGYLRLNQPQPAAGRILVRTSQHVIA